MYYFQHRLSFDIDLFVNDAQYLGFFSPKLWIDDCAHFDSARYIDQHNHIGVTNKDNIKIDILLDYASNEGYIDDSKKIFSFDIHVESLENIIAKKITFRKTDNKTRDIFDISVALYHNDGLFDQLLNDQKITKQDLLTLQNSLQELNKEKYNAQIKIVKPTQEYSHIALNAPNNMDGINNQFRTNALNQVLDNSYQKFLVGNDSYNALGSIEQVKALKFYDLVLNFNPQSEKLESALFFKQIVQYAKGLRLKILSAPISKKDLARLEKLENTINQEKERLEGKDLNALEQEILKEQENALKLKESIKASQNHTKTLKNAINQKENAKNPIEQQRQNLESQRNEKEREKQNQEHDKHNKEQERNNLNNEINAIGNERLTFKQLGTPWNFLGIQPYLNNNGWGRTYARAFFSDKNKSIREYCEIETKIKNILGFYRIGESDERILYRFLELPSYRQNELTLLLMQ